jgi:protein-tyrosine phosphatase
MWHVRNLRGLQRMFLAHPRRHFDGPPRILMVCRANICRSPMAEAVLRKLLRGRVPAAVDSAGIEDCCANMPPHPMALAASKRRGYNVCHTVSRPVRESDFATFDLIVAVDSQVRDALCVLAPREARAEIRLLLDFGSRYYRQDVPDPHGFGPAVFERSLDMIEDGCAGLRDYIGSRRAMAY